jgi:hypothetical protein
LGTKALKGAEWDGGKIWLNDATIDSSPYFGSRVKSCRDASIACRLLDWLHDCV